MTVRINTLIIGVAFAIVGVLGSPLLAEAQTARQRYERAQERDRNVRAVLDDTSANASAKAAALAEARKVVVAFQRMGSQKTEAEELSPREREVLELLARGYLYKEIAESLHLSVPTVNTYIRRIYEKLHVRSRSQAVAKFTQIPGAAVSASTWPVATSAA